MTEQENELNLDERDWIKRHGVKFIQGVLWELGLDEEPEKTLIEVLTTIHEETELYVFDSDSAQGYARDCDAIDFSYGHLCASARRKRIKTRQERINARRKRKLETMDDEDSLPWE